MKLLSTGRIPGLRAKRVISSIVSLGLVGTGVVLMAIFALGFFGITSESTATNAGDPRGFNVPDLGNEQAGAGGPEDKTLTLTVPKMDRLQEATVPDATGGDEEALKENAGIHLRSTGFPWQEEANVYVAGHRLGYPGTDSFLAFYGQNKLEKGDEIYVTDSEGKKYTYRVFKSFITGPTDLSVTEPVEGKNILTLQTCTLPDYTKRLITQAELVDEA
jgi:sortase A